MAVSKVGLFEKIDLTKPSSPKTSLKNSSLLLKVNGEKLALDAEKAPPLIKFLAWVNAEKTVLATWATPFGSNTKFLYRLPKP